MKYQNGVALGRFQPFHKGHLKYILKSLAKCDTLYIGITTPGKFLTKYEPQDLQRLRKENNPFSYKERRVMIIKSLEEKHIDLKKIRFINFKPSKILDWHSRVPKDAVYFLLLISAEEELKVKQMQAQGLKVIILETLSSRKHQAFDIRQKILNNKPWRHLVPSSVYDYLSKVNIQKKLKQ